MNISKDINDAIKKNLPEAVGEELRRYLEQAQKEKDLIKDLQLRINYLETALNNENEIGKKLRFAIKEHGDLKLREEAVAKQENTLRVTLAESRADAALNRSADIFTLVSTIFKNPVIRKNVYTNDIMGNTTYDQSGRLVNAKTGENRTETTEEE